MWSGDTAGVDKAEAGMTEGSSYIQTVAYNLIINIKIELHKKCLLVTDVESRVALVHTHAESGHCSAFVSR